VHAASGVPNRKFSLKNLIFNDCSLVRVMVSTRVRVRVNVSAPGPRVRPMVRVDPGVAAAAIQGLHDLVFAGPGADYIRTSLILLLTTGVMANFLLQFRNFRYLGNRGWCDTNFVCTVKFADPENPMFCVRIGVISPLEAKL